MVLIDFEIHGNSSGFDGDATLLFIGPCIHVWCGTSFGRCNNAGFGDQGIGEGGLAVIDCKTAQGYNRPAD